MIAIIAAMTKNRVIGRNGDIPWHISEDFLRFKAITFGHPIIMGRKTYDSIVKIRKERNFRGTEAMPGRTNIVISSNTNLQRERCIVVSSVSEAIEQAKNAKEGGDSIFIIGGQSIFDQTINLADKLYMTVINQEISGDSFFPDIDPNIWSVEEKTIRKVEWESFKLSYSFITYTRSSS